MPATQALAPREPGLARKEENPVLLSPADAGHVMSCQLDRDPAQVRHARKQAREALCDWGLDEHAGLAELVVSELATNAICHGAGTARIGVSHAGGELRVEVHDDGRARPARRQPGAGEETGRGLALIDGLIELQGGQRGITEDSTGPGKTVYVVIRLFRPADQEAGTG
ncbi:MAG TPA: ATP-binding protein [Streptosporangiaceae bacterium]|nr:ATP-binding protein [Streptosporangiaceae bacterium]